MAKNKKINVQGIDIVLYEDNKVDFISLTDIARYKNPTEPKDVVKNWMRSRTTIEFLGLWEQLNNLDFKGVEFDSFVRRPIGRFCDPGSGRTADVYKSCVLCNKGSENREYLYII